MPAGKLINVDWLNQNAARKYPLADDATATDTTGSFTLPDDFILELDLPVHAGLDVEPGRFFVSAVAAYATGFLITVSYQPEDGEAVPAASAVVPRDGHERYQVYALGGVDPFYDTSGHVVVGRLDAIDRQPAGMFRFDFEAGRLDPDATRPVIRGVTGLILVNGSEESAPVTGDVRLVAGTNVRLTVDGQDVRVDAIAGEGLVDECVCDESAPGNPITSIGGVQPTPGGDFFFVGDGCVQFQAIPNGLRVVDTCSEPCCGFGELEKITEALERVLAEKKTAQSFVDRLQANVDVMNTTVLGARLSDRTCVIC